MLNQQALDEVLERYTADFAERWKTEQYKWEAVKCFQENWNIEDEDFGAMFEAATEKTGNLLASSNFSPRNMIEEFVELDQEKVRSMFRELFDESKPFEKRISAFQDGAQEMMKMRTDWKDKWSYQNTAAISTYLWLMFPDKYYIYRYSIYRKVSNMLFNGEYTIKKNNKIENVIDGYKMYDELCEAINKNEKVSTMFREAIEKGGYYDPELKTAVIDIGYYIKSVYGDDDKGKNSLYPADYNPGLTKEDWLELLSNPEVFNDSALRIMKRMKDYGGEATCTQLAQKYGRQVNFYNSGSSSLAERIHKKTGCPLAMDNNIKQYWPVLYTGEYIKNKGEGTFKWRLRDELNEALNDIDLSNIPLYEEPESAEGSSTEPSYWWLVASPNNWSFSNIRPGETVYYTFYNENGRKRRIFANFENARPGDKVIGYEATPVKKIVALGEITGKETDSRLYFTKKEHLAVPVDFSVLKDCPELADMEFLHGMNGSLFKLTKEEYDFLMDVIREANPLQQGEAAYEKYDKARFLSEVYITDRRYDELKELLEYKKNIILQGPPGVGKTYLAKRLAYSIMGEKDGSRIKFIQFHQNYSYEDFIMGYRPCAGGFSLVNGVFYDFCQHAANDSGRKYFFIIDEINRGNLSKIFGEVLMLLEYRKEKAVLAYSRTYFSVPENLYLIGMMNTADRSLAMLDYALRRRFCFFDMEPALGAAGSGFEEYQKTLNNEMFDKLIDNIKLLNQEIAGDKSLGRGYQIGHSYFCGLDKDTCTPQRLGLIVKYEILPMLAEYWFDDADKLGRWQKILSGVINDKG